MPELVWLQPVALVLFVLSTAMFIRHLVVTRESTQEPKKATVSVSPLPRDVGATKRLTRD